MQVLQLGIDICRGLDACQQKHIIHRDIKPQNIFVAEDGRYKLGDFGIAKISSQISSGTRTGTYRYMAPEVYHNQPYGSNADLYSLGMVLYWLMNERRMPFLPLPPGEYRAEDAEEVRKRRMAGEPLPPPVHGSRELQRIILKACAYRPEDRYPTAKAMLEELLGLQSGRISEERNMVYPSGSDDQAADRTAVMPAEMVQRLGLSDSAPSEPVQMLDTSKRKGRRKKAKRILIVMVVLLTSLVGILVGTGLKPRPEQTQPTEPLSAVTAQTTELTVPVRTGVLKPDQDLIPWEMETEAMVFGSAYSRSSITEIRFLNTLQDKPSDAWDVSESGMGDVRAWVDGGVLSIAAQGGVNAPEDCDSLFACYDNLKQISFGGNFHTEDVNVMDMMFYGCTALETMDIETFDTSNVTRMHHMFSDCSSLKTLDVRGFDTSGVTDMGGMFFGCKSLTSLDVTGFDTSHVDNMNGMFSGCEQLSILDVSSFDTSHVNDMSIMFGNCLSLKSLNMTGLDTSRAENMNGMFLGCKQIEELDVSHFDTSRCEDFSGMFSDCSLLKTLDVSGFDTSALESWDGMFS